MRYEVPVSRASYHNSITAVFVFNRVENLCLILHTNVLTLQTLLLTGLQKFQFVNKLFEMSKVKILKAFNFLFMGENSAWLFV